jgi:serine/threonine protein kinase
MSSTANRAVDRLLGRTLPNGWLVKERLERAPDETGGHFSAGYIVSHGSKPDGFLKALDFSDALKSGDPARALLQLTQAYLFERDLCISCAKRAFDHVVVAIDHGVFDVDSSDPLGKVQYIIFELADGDIRRHLNTAEQLDVAFALRALHNVAVGLQQIHSESTAHQDLKPSNVLQFSDKSKVADLGRASSQSLSSPFDALDVAGDKGYAPPELRYGYRPEEWGDRRLGCDLYLFGSFVLFVFTRCTMTGEILSRIPHDSLPGVWKGHYRDLLPTLNQAFSRVLDGARESLPAVCREPLLEMLKQLCDPDPLMRGHPEEARPGRNRHSLQRFVSQLNQLAIDAYYRRRPN